VLCLACYKWRMIFLGLASLSLFMHLHRYARSVAAAVASFLSPNVSAILSPLITDTLSPVPPIPTMPLRSRRPVLQELRQIIVPSAKAYKLDKLMAALDTYMEKSGQRVFVEYVMLGPDVNCTEEQAHQLGELLRGRNVTLNLIPWNPILSPGMTFDAPIGGRVDAFAVTLKMYGVPVTVRREKGSDVAAACGQLVLEAGVRCVGESRGLKDVEDLMCSA
jgi:hypothetical protein